MCTTQVQQVQAHLSPPTPTVKEAWSHFTHSLPLSIYNFNCLVMERESELHFGTLSAQDITLDHKLVKSSTPHAMIAPDMLFFRLFFSAVPNLPFSLKP